MKTHLPRSFAATSLAALVAVSSAFGCSECGCSLSSDWAAQGFSSLLGFSVSTRFEYYDQVVLRHGTHTLDRGTLTLPDDDEIQLKTLNRNSWLGLDYVASRAWAFSAQIPYYDRFHSTIAPGDTDSSTSHGTGLGDVRLSVRYSDVRAANSFSVQFGLKFPTGCFTQNFGTGPQSGAPLDRGLQLGTGTSNLLAGVSYFARPATKFGCFAQMLLEQPLAARAAFLPSTSVAFNSGVRWLNSSSFTPQLQINTRWESREHGAASDRDNSGGTFIHVSPGVTVELSQNMTGWAFVQAPVLQRVNGRQLEPRWLLSLGLQLKL